MQLRDGRDRMSELLNRIKEDQVAARKAGNKNEAVVLTTLLGEAGPSGNSTVDDEQVQKVVQKFIKNLNDVIGFTANPEVQERMKYEIKILERYMPAQLSESQLRGAIKQALTRLQSQGVTGPKCVGMVMKELSTHYKGQFDGKVASNIVKEMVQ